MKLAKIGSDGFIDIVECDTKIGRKITELRNAGFLDFVPSEQPQCDSGYKSVDSFTVENGKIVQSWEVKIDPQAVQDQINELKNQLYATDYQVVKCMEATLIGTTIPYDIEAIHAERQAIRDEINRLEALL